MSEHEIEPEEPREEGSEFQAVVDAIKTTAANEEMAENLAAFARANPQMAYENMLRQGLINREGQLVSPEMNQQSQSVTSQTYGSSLGTEVWEVSPDELQQP